MEGHILSGVGPFYTAGSSSLPGESSVARGVGYRRGEGIVPPASDCLCGITPGLSLHVRAHCVSYLSYSVTYNFRICKCMIFVPAI